MCLSKLQNMKFIKFCIMGARTKAWRNDLLRVINFAKCICLNCKINLFKLQNVFVQNTKCVCLKAVKRHEYIWLKLDRFRGSETLC